MVRSTTGIEGGPAARLTSALPRTTFAIHERPTLHRRTGDALAATPMRTIQDYHTPMIGRGHDLSKQRMGARNRIDQA